eukprot:m.229891 g.229891  ORF g.229891 m.229891 type:complete len:86 (-) comp13888_c1_seq2:219-476(-)
MNEMSGREEFWDFGIFGLLSIRYVIVVILLLLRRIFFLAPEFAVQVQEGLGYISRVASIARTEFGEDHPLTVDAVEKEEMLKQFV